MTKPLLISFLISSTAVLAQTPDANSVRNSVVGAAGVVASVALFRDGNLRATEADFEYFRIRRVRNMAQSAVLEDYRKAVDLAKTDIRYARGAEILTKRKKLTEDGASRVAQLEGELNWYKGDRVRDPDMIRRKLSSLPRQIAVERRKTQEAVAALDRQLAEIGFSDAEKAIERAILQRDVATEVLWRGHVDGELSMRAPLPLEDARFLLSEHRAIAAEFNRGQARLDRLERRATRSRAAGVLAIAAAAAAVASGFEKDDQENEDAGATPVIYRSISEEVR